ncbi:MAG TPA: DJ-1/PfpI family protein [Chromatiaceae bacterium]|nr:DJ-1/PfpI family protein [Chromatiaceae bacterium]
MARVLVPLAQGCEELEAVSIIDLLRRAGVEVVVAGLSQGPVTCSRGVVIMPDADLDDVLGDDFDMIVLPGGLPGADHLDADARIRRLLKKMAEQDKFIAAICAAPKVLASAGLLQGKQATSYPGVIDTMGLADTRYLDQPVVADGRVVTSRGPGTAMDFALELIEKLLGAEQRQIVEASLMRPD